MSALSWPAFSRAPRNVEWQILSATVDTGSPLSGIPQTNEFAAPKWGLVVDYKFVLEADANLMKAFLARMRGRAGRVNVWNLERPRIQGTASGSPLVQGAANTGTSLAIDGLAAGATFVAGDMIGIPGQLLMVVAAATANGSGEVTLTIEQPLRATPADNAAVTLIQPTCKMLLTEDLARWSPRPMPGTDRLHEFSLQLVEDPTP
jgi:hypothetical protein